MDYKELTQQVKALEDEQKKIERSIEAKIRRRDKKILDLKLQYIAEHQPLPLKRFQTTIGGLQKYVGDMIRFVDDVLRETAIPDIEKARMVDLRNSLVQSADFLKDRKQDGSHLPEEWSDLKEKEN